MSRADPTFTTSTGETFFLSYDMSNPENGRAFMHALPALLEMTTCADKAAGENAAHVLGNFCALFRSGASIDPALKDQIANSALESAATTSNHVILCNLLFLLGSLSDRNVDMKRKILAHDAFLLRIKTLLSGACEGKFSEKIENRITTYIIAMIATLTEHDIRDEGCTKLLAQGFLPLLRALQVKELTDERARRNINIVLEYFASGHSESAVAAGTTSIAEAAESADSDMEGAEFLMGLRSPRY